MKELKADRVLDAKGLVCPMPVLKTKKSLDDLEAGQVLDVVTTDPASKSDIPALIKRLGHELIELTERDMTFFFKIRKR
ncbi:MAG: sulfurtransferase TusA family protein [Thermodesulfovibrionales bacterium]